MRHFIFAFLCLAFLAGCASTQNETTADEKNPSRTEAGRFFMTSGGSDK